MNGPGIARLLDPDATASAIEILGVHVGGPAALLRDAPLTGVSTARGFRAKPDASAAGRNDDDTGPSLSSLIDEAFESAGWLMTDQVKFRLEGGVVRQIVVSEAALDALRIENEGDVIARFGEPAGYERRFGLRTAFYPARDFSVAWHVAKKRLEQITLGGEAGWVEPTAGARELLNLLLESWKSFEEDGFAEPPASQAPLYHRHRHASALCAALGLGSLADAAGGAFVERGDVRRFRRVCEQLRAESSLPAHLLEEFALPPEWRTDDNADELSQVYQGMLGFYRQARALLSYNRGWSVCSDPVWLGLIRMTNKAAKPLEASLVPVETALLGFLDPDDRRFPLRELIARYGYTDVDLGEIDAEWY
jgi:hypothetical protein